MGIKESATSVKGAAVALTTISLFIGAVLTVDTRYAHAQALKEEVSKTSEAVAESEKRTQVLLKAQTVEMRMQTQILRKQLLEDKVFELDAKRDTTKRALAPVDEAQYRRYSRQLEEVSRTIEAVR